MIAELTTERAPVSLLARVAAGDAAALREVLARYGGLVWSTARRFEPDEAEDAVQEIFVELWKHAGRFDPALSSEATFISMVARRRLIDRRRRREHRPALHAEAEPPVIIDDGAGPARSAEAAQAARAMTQLPPAQREVVLLATCHGWSHAEIAEQTGIPLGTVKAHVRRGLLAVRAVLLGRKERP